MKTVLYFQSSLCASNNAELEGVYRYAKLSKWRVQVLPYAEAASGRLHVGTKAERPDVKGLLAFWKPSGAIIDCGAAPGLLGPADFGFLPAVFIDRTSEKGETCVTSDARAIAEAAARELLSLGYPTTCAYVPWMTDIAWSRTRGEAFAEIVRMNGRKCHMFRKRPFRDDKETYRSWLKDWLKAVPKPCGVFAANDYIASLVLSCAAVEKIRVPDELAVVGVDDDEQICEHATPTLTSILPDNEKIGYLAAELLHERMLHPKKKIKSAVVAPVAVHRRESTRAYKRKDDRVAAAVELIRRRACDGLKARDVVAEMGCSRRLAELRFREVTGRSLLGEIQSARIARAKFLLEHASDSIYDIACRCSYGSTEALRKVFAAETKMSPAAWRKRKNRK